VAKVLLDIDIQYSIFNIQYLYSIFNMQFSILNTSYSIILADHRPPQFEPKTRRARVSTQRRNLPRPQLLAHQRRHLGPPLPRIGLGIIFVQDCVLVWSETPSIQRTGQDRTGQDRTGQDRTGQDRTGQDRTGQDRTGQDRTGQDRTGQERKGKDVFSSLHSGARGSRQTRSLTHLDQ
jgi:hypothetical protein